MHNQSRVLIENISPVINNGELPIKSIVGEIVSVTADILADGHDILAAALLYKSEKDRSWTEAKMSHITDDQWVAVFKVEKQGYCTFKIEAWVDYALNWQYGITRKLEDHQHVSSELLEGADYLRKYQKNATAAEKTFLSKCIKAFTDKKLYKEATEFAKSDKLKNIFTKYPEKHLANESGEFPIYVDREKARFSTWYEFFPRSASEVADKHGTFKDCERLLRRVAEMGFDTLYFPPVHPIGEVNRKGKNNTTEAKKGDVGSTWGIGSKYGGHKDIHPELGSLSDFQRLVKKAEKLGIEIAMDFAIQAAPDHPWVKSNPDWFKWRPDGSVQYAENPPKKYQDILPIYFESSDWKNLWQEMLDTALFWVEECGIKVFRVDNPHTKPFYFWEWLISEVKKKYPDVLFLAEAFTRPKIMHQLAKRGFTQSYTYFTWRNNKQELIEYMNELTKTDQKYFFRPNFWPNTPDINPWSLQGGNEAMHLQRYFLAATLSSNTGIYGPVFEQMVSEALPGKEEYMDSEKFQLRHWDWNKQNKLTTIIGKINSIRKERASLQQTYNIDFLNIDNDQILAYYKFDDSRSDETIMIANLDPHYEQKGWIQLPLASLGIHDGQTIKVTDQITGSSYHWDKEWCYIELHPALPFHLFKIQK